MDAPVGAKSPDIPPAALPLAAAEQAAPLSTPAEPEKIAALKPEDSSPPEPAKPEIPVSESPAKTEAASALADAPVPADETRIAATGEAAPPANEAARAASGQTSAPALMRNRGRPLSRTMIVEHVWDMDYDGLTNIVDV